MTFHERADMQAELYKKDAAIDALTSKLVLSEAHVESLTINLEAALNEVTKIGEQLKDADMSAGHAEAELDRQKRINNGRLAEIERLHAKVKKLKADFAKREQELIDSERETSSFKARTDAEERDFYQRVALEQGGTIANLVSEINFLHKVRAGQASIIEKLHLREQVAKSDAERLRRERDTEKEALANAESAVHCLARENEFLLTQNSKLEEQVKAMGPYFCPNQYLPQTYPCPQGVRSINCETCQREFWRDRQKY